MSDRDKKPFVTTVEAVGVAREILYPSRLLAFGRDAVIRSGLISVPGEPNQIDALRELEPVVERELNRHNRTRQPWAGVDFLPLDEEGRVLGRVAPDEAPMLSKVAHDAMVVNLLTEDNLPSYHREIAGGFGLEHPWGTWVNQWTAEEDTHAYVMRSFLDLTRAVDPHYLEMERMAQMQRGYTVEKSPLNTLAYVTFQELATRVSHRQTGIAANNVLADEMLARIAKDENLHMLFYRNLAEAAFDVTPNQMMCAVRDEVIGFEMPGSNIDGFQLKAMRIAEAGIYDTPRHLEEIVLPVLKKWRVFDREFSGAGAEAQAELADYIEKMRVLAARFKDRRDSGALARSIEALERRAGK